YYDGSEHIEERYEDCNDFLNHKCPSLLIDYIYDDLFISGGVPAEKISFIEKNLDIELDAEYKSFLMKYGMIMGYGVEILGCGRNGTFPVIEQTLRYRKSGLENDYIVIRNADEWVYCLNVKTGAVSSWDITGKNHIIVSDSFDKYVLEELEESDEDDDE
ncbi:MAG: SMI1/KNR4 family protein, partial [Ruminococcus sp.]|nr:SMI1/KNR4 family protein [Ruminococcus sp.]